jgi:accessory gene regulator B
VDHPNKPIISEERRRKFKINSIITYAIMLGISFLIGGKYGNTAFMALVVESITLPIGYYKNKK